jgi:hypothetical protein
VGSDLLIFKKTKLNTLYIYIYIYTLAEPRILESPGTILTASGKFSFRVFDVVNIYHRFYQLS